MKSDQFLQEASWVNGRIQDPSELVWKQTGMSYEAAVAEFGKDNVRKEGKARDGHEVIAVLVPLGESQGGGSEYNDEAGSMKDNLHTIVRMCKELAKTLQANENLPEWAQEKVAQAKGMLVSVGDYIIDQHEQGKVYNNEAMMAGGMEAFSMESAERQYKKLLGEAGPVPQDPNVDHGLGKQSNGKFITPGQKFDTATGQPLSQAPAFQAGRTTVQGGSTAADKAADKLQKMVDLRDALVKRAQLRNDPADIARAKQLQNQIRQFKAGQQVNVFGVGETKEAPPTYHDDGTPIDVKESAGGMGAGSVASVPAVGGGSLFGGNYTNPDNPFAKKTKKTKIIKR